MESLGIPNVSVDNVIVGLLTAIVSVTGAYFIARYNSGRVQKVTKDSIIKTYQLPLLNACVELESRLGRIIHNSDKDWLDEKYLKEIQKGWGFAKDATRVGYFISSTAFYVAVYFCWLEIINRQIGHVFDPKTKSFSEFNEIISKVSRVFQWKEIWNECESLRNISCEKDAWLLHRQFQHSVGEILILSENGILRPCSFREFFENYLKSEKFKYWMKPVEEYFVGLARFPSGSTMSVTESTKDFRLLRLVALRYWIRKLIELLSDTLGIVTPLEEQVELRDLPNDVKRVIRSMEAPLNGRYFLRYRVK